jgi:N-acetyl-anhydromuramyl-L-alanine amidase AmpD
MPAYPPAIQRPGPAAKIGYPGATRNAAAGIVCHSMVGSAAGAMAVLDDPARRASWHFSVLRDGAVLQHFDSHAVAWHCGSREWNARTIGIEHEGGFEPADEPLTPPQRASSVALVRWLAAQHGFALRRGDGLWEHREVAPASDPTACPSGRIPWQHYTAEGSPWRAEGSPSKTRRGEWREARMYTDTDVDAKIGELYRQLAALGKKIDELAAAITPAIVDHNRRLVAIEQARQPRPDASATPA